jgi:hypothetical protein
MGVVFSGTYNGIVLSDPVTQNPATVAAGSFVTATYGPAAIFGAPGYSWTVTNLGTVDTTPFSAYPIDCVYLAAGGGCNQWAK